MGHFNEITINDIQDALNQSKRGKPAQRLFTAIGYKIGITQSELAEWFEVERKTINTRLTRLAELDFQSSDGTSNS